MGFQFNGTQANVTLSGSGAMQLPASNQTVINISSVGNGANQNAYTVTAGKTFYLMGCSGGAASACSIFIYKHDGTTKVVELYQAANVSFILNGTNPIWAYTSAQNVVVKFTNASNYSFWGIEQ